MTCLGKEREILVSVDCLEGRKRECRGQEDKRKRETDSENCWNDPSVLGYSICTWVLSKPEIILPFLYLFGGFKSALRLKYRFEI